MVRHFLVRHSLTQLVNDKHKHDVSDELIASALNDLKRDGYERAYAIMLDVLDMEPGESITFEEGERKTLRVAHGCTYDTRRLLGPLLGYRTITRA